MEIVYKQGICYAKAEVREGKVRLIIPVSQQGNETFLHKMQALGAKLQHKLDRKQKNQIFTSE